MGRAPRSARLDFYQFKSRIISTHFFHYSVWPRISLYLYFYIALDRWYLCRIFRWPCTCGPHTASLQTYTCTVFCTPKRAELDCAKQKSVQYTLSEHHININSSYNTPTLYNHLPYSTSLQMYIRNFFVAYTQHQRKYIRPHKRNLTETDHEHKAFRYHVYFSVKIIFTFYASGCTLQCSFPVAARVRASGRTKSIGRLGWTQQVYSYNRITVNVAKFTSDNQTINV